MPAAWPQPHRHASTHTAGHVCLPQGDPREAAGRNLYTPPGVALQECWEQFHKAQLETSRHRPCRYSAAPSVEQEKWDEMPPCYHLSYTTKEECLAAMAPHTPVLKSQE